VKSKARAERAAARLAAQASAQAQLTPADALPFTSTAEDVILAPAQDTILQEAWDVPL